MILAVNQIIVSCNSDQVQYPMYYHPPIPFLKNLESGGLPLSLQHYVCTWFHYFLFISHHNIETTGRLLESNFFSEKIQLLFKFYIAYMVTLVLFLNRLYLYIYFSNVPSTGLDGSLVCKTHFPNPPMGVQYLVGTVWAKKIDPVKKKSRFARTARPQRAKTCSAHYISHLKTTVQRLGALK